VKQIITNTVTVTKETFIEKPKGFFDYIKLGVGVGVMTDKEWNIKYGPQIGVYYVFP